MIKFFKKSDTCDDILTMNDHTVYSTLHFSHVLFKTFKIFFLTTPLHHKKNFIWQNVRLISRILSTTVNYLRSTNDLSLRERFTNVRYRAKKLIKLVLIAISINAQNRWSCTEALLHKQRIPASTIHRQSSYLRINDFIRQLADSCFVRIKTKTVSPLRSREVAIKWIVKAVSREIVYGEQMPT